MGAALLVTFRESLEASLVVGLVLAVLKKTGRQELRSSVWAGLVGGLAVSAAVAYAFIRILGDFEGREEQLFEGSAMVLGAVLLASLILWTGSHRSGEQLRDSTNKAQAGGWLGLAALVFVSILREGVETVIYLGSSLRGAGFPLFAAGMVGVVLACFAGFFVFSSGRRAGLKHLFSATTFLLVLFGAGLFGRAAGEFGEAGYLPPLVAPVWSIAPWVSSQTPPLFNDEGLVGSFFKGLFGYVSSPSLTQVIAYLTYILVVGSILLLRSRRPRPAV